MKRICVIFLVLLTFNIVCSGHNVRDYGAVGDGTAIDSPAIQKAIDACTASGGGTVLVPAGTYLCATIILKDNVKLHLAEDALLLGVTDLNLYDMIDSFTEGLGIQVGRTFIAAVDASNIAIEGKGTIDGQGSALKEKHIMTDIRPEGERWGERPFLLRIIRCKGVTVEDVTLKYSASWTSHYQQSSDIRIHNVKILSKGVAHNDGIGIDGCQRVRITDCDVESGDDALVFKTTHSQYPCSDIVATNLRLKSNQAGIKMGTESMAAFENIKISDCYIYDTNNGGIKLFSVDGARLQNIEITDIVMDNIRTPILLRLGSRLNVFRKGEDTQQSTGIFQNVTIRNVKAVSAAQTQLTHASGILITGVPGHDIRDLTLENIHIELPGGAPVEEGRHQVPEAVDQYPEVKTFGPVIPAYGIWMRHVDGVRMNDISFVVDSADLRPVLICEDAKNVVISALEAVCYAGSESAIRVEDSQGLYVGIHGITGESAALIEAKGAGTWDINLLGLPQMTYSEKIVTTGGAERRAVSNF